MSIANKALAVLAALAFFLSFITVSVSGTNPFMRNAKQELSLSVSGAKVIQCYLRPCTAKDILGSQPGIVGAMLRNIPDSATRETIKLSGREAPDAGINFLLFAAIAVIIAAITVFPGARASELLSGLASVGGIILLFLFRSKVVDLVSAQFPHDLNFLGTAIKLDWQFGMGFWACAVLSGLSAILAFKGTGGGQRSLAAAASGSMGGYAPQPQAGATPSSGEQLAVCSSCGSVNTAGNKFCLSCGGAITAPAVQQPQNKAVAEPQGPVCPACGSSKAGTGKFCLACGAAMAASAVQQPEKKIVAEPQGPVCPACGSSKAGTGKFCLACGAAMAASAVQQPEKKVVAESQGPVCPSCGSTKPGTGKFCLACGGSLMAGVQLFQPSETHTSVAPVAAAAAAAPVAAAPPDAMAAQASAGAPVGQPLRATAPVVAATPRVENPVASTAVPPVEDEPVAPASQVAPPAASPQAAEQTSLDWTKPPSSQPKQQACAACGAALKAEQKFCLACGTPVGQAQAPAKTEAPKFTPAPQPEPIQPPAPTRIFEPAPRSSSMVWILVVVLLAAAGTGGWFAWKYFTRPDVTVTAIRPKIHVATGGKADLDVNVSDSSDIDWSIQEGQKGGQVTGLGAVMVSGQPLFRASYVAPQTTGIYHVIATSHANPSRSAQVEITVVGTALPGSSATATEPAPPTAATATPSTVPATTTSPAVVFPAAAQIIGTWSGPTSDMRTAIGADSTISMTSAANPQKNLSGTYRFTDNSHLDVDFGNGDVRKWEIRLDGNNLLVNSQSGNGASALIFQKLQ
ncbi:MAG TPA: hypothetical protein VI636_20700 [Candidatus Angelobacter sp.]